MNHIEILKSCHNLPYLAISCLPKLRWAQAHPGVDPEFCKLWGPPGCTAQMAQAQLKDALVDFWKAQNVNPLPLLLAAVVVFVTLHVRNHGGALRSVLTSVWRICKESANQLPFASTSKSREEEERTAFRPVYGTSQCCWMSRDAVRSLYGSFSKTARAAYLLLVCLSSTPFGHSRQVDVEC